MISVIIPVFNRRESVVRAIHSVLAQIDAEFEVLVIDDGSTEGSAEVVRENFANQVQIHRFKENRGVSAARNQGIDRAHGEWIALLDSDDEWKPQKLSRQMRALCSSGLRICHTDEIWIRNGVRVNPHKHHEKDSGNLFARSLELCCMSPSSILMCRETLLQAEGFDERLLVCEDYDLFIRLTCRHQVAFVPDKLVVKYGGHADQLSRAYPAMDRFRVYAINKLLRTDELNPEQRQAAVETLVQKARIVIQGAKKRNNLDLANSMQSHIDRWRGLE